MITTATESAIIMITIFDKSNNDKTDLFLAKVNHLELLPVATKKISGVCAILDAALINSVQKS